MSTLADRLRAIVASVPAARPADARDRSGATSQLPRDGAPTGEPGDSIVDVLDGQWHDVDGQRVLVVERRYRPGHRHGRMVLMDHLLPGGETWRRVLLGSSRPVAQGEQMHRTLFIDLETTGLGGGAGSYAFLVGCGWFEGAVFVVRQFVLDTYTAERALLQAVARLSRECALLVSYNGKSFDVPLIDTRFLFNRMSPVFGDVPHLDMLHTARRLWRETDGSSTEGVPGCRLVVFEQTLCGLGREGDVPGFEIPGRYNHYVRTGDARPLLGVLEHNRLDLVTLAVLTARAARLAEEGAFGACSATEAVGLGRLYERAGMLAEARTCFARAAGLDGHAPLPGHLPVLAHALRGYAGLCRRQRRYREAANAWQRLVELPECPPQALREAAEALAVHHEHRLRDPLTARQLAIRTLPLQGTPARRQAIEHRLSRLDRKIDAHAGVRPMPLF